LRTPTPPSDERRIAAIHRAGDPALNRTVLHPIGWCSLEILLAWVPQQATDEDNLG